MVEPVKEDKLIFNGNATILFKDGKKYVTKCDESDTYDREKGLLTVLAKANGYNYETIQEMLKNATIKGKDKQVREVKRKAKVGEYVKVVRNRIGNIFHKGDICKSFEFTVFIQDGIYVYNADDDNELKIAYLYPNDYVVLENYKPKEKDGNVKR